MTGPAPAPGSVRGESWLWLFFAAAWALHLAFSLVNWDATLFGLYQFRQAQTALAVAHFPADGFPLAYETPLFGPPWALPLEFPLFQASVAHFAQLTGLGLEPAGRAVSWLFFQAGLPAVFLVLGALGIRRSLRWLTLGLLVTSPLYLFHSRNLLIESLAWAAGMWFLAGFARFLDRPRAGWFAVAAIAGALAAVVKITTWAVFVLAAGLWLLAWWRTGRFPFGRGVARAVPPALPGLAAGLAWTWHARAIRNLNPEAAFLDSHFGSWSFGELAQRFTWSYWHRTTEIWITGIVTEAGLLAAILLLTRASRPRRQAALLAFAAFLGGQLVFANLYFVHDYYFYATAAFLVGAVGLLVGEFFADAQQPAWVRWTVPVLLVGFQLSTYSRTYLPHQRVDLPVPEYMRAVADLTRPEDIIIVAGQDWDASLAFYSGRRVLMLPAGRENEPERIKRTLARLPAADIGAVMLCGELRDRVDLIEGAFSPLALGTAPLLFGESARVAIWIPQARLAAALERLPHRPYLSLRLNPPPAPASGGSELGARQIAGRREFALMSPRPRRATVQGGFSAARVGDLPVLNAHAPFVLEFQVPPGAGTLEVVVGIHDGAHADPAGHTDGVTFEVLQTAPDGTVTSLWRSHLDPFREPAHRGPQALALKLAPGGGQVVLRSTNGPAGNAGFDWSYVGPLRFR